ncbi:MAG: hypothetical protein ACYCYI_07320 [Saccharofermentanales bacterium]
MLKFKRIISETMPNGAWFIFQVKPFPPLNQLQMVIADIYRNQGTYLLNDGTLTHSIVCKEYNHLLPSVLTDVIKIIEPLTFSIAVWEGNFNLLSGQPIVFPLEPEITYDTYPDHPHINASCIWENMYIPESICYTDKPSELGNNSYTRILEAIQQTCIWLFKHQVWLASRKLGNRIWIGPELKTKDDDQFTFFRNPYGKCRCGNNSLYHLCHLTQDFKNGYKSQQNILLNSKNIFLLFSNPDGSFNLELYYKWWLENHDFPHRKTLSQYKKALST